jgi:PTS system sucrose-specific IIC component
MKGLTFVLVDIALRQWGAIGGYILAATFLPLVMLGIHQGLTPIHAQLITDTGYTVLLPILAMAGAGQVGMALAVYVKTKNKRLKQLITNALPIGILGVGEPLIYGVSLPLFYPFITACLGAGFGGMVVGLVTSTLGDVGATAIGPSGVVLIPLIANGLWLWYLLGLVSAYIGGFVLTYFFGYKETMLEKLK